MLLRAASHRWGKFFKCIYLHLHPLVRFKCFVTRGIQQTDILLWISRFWKVQQLNCVVMKFYSSIRWLYKWMFELNYQIPRKYLNIHFAHQIQQFQLALEAKWFRPNPKSSRVRLFRFYYVQYIFFIFRSNPHRTASNCVNVPQSFGVAADAYSIRWYNYTVKVHRDVHMIVMRAQRPLTLNAINLGTMSAATFLRVSNGCTKVTFKRSCR